MRVLKFLLAMGIKIGDYDFGGENGFLRWRKWDLPRQFT